MKVAVHLNPGVKGVPGAVKPYNSKAQCAEIPYHEDTGIFLLVMLSLSDTGFNIC